MDMLEPELRKEMFNEVKFAGIVPVPVAAMTDGSACWRSHSIVSPSDLCPSSRVSWKTLAAHNAGIRIRRPRPSTFVWRSLVEVRFGGGFLDGSGEIWRVEVEEMAREVKLLLGVGTELEQEAVAAEADSSSSFPSN